jgi:hypothetical protein
VGEVLGLHSAHPRSLSILRTNQGQEARRLFRARQALFQKRAEESQKKQRERYVCLKEGSGNLSLSLFMLAAAVYEHRSVAITLTAIAAVLYYTHLVLHE